MLLLVAVTVTVTFLMLTELVPLVAFAVARAAEAAEVNADNSEVGDEGSRPGADVMAVAVVASTVEAQVAAVGRSDTLYAEQKLFAKLIAAV